MNTSNDEQSGLDGGKAGRCDPNGTCSDIKRYTVYSVTNSERPNARNWGLRNSFYRPDKNSMKHAILLSKSCRRFVTKMGKKRIGCPICSSSFRCLADLKLHCVLHTNERPYRCIVPECGKSFKWRSGVFYHVRKHVMKGDITIDSSVGPVVTQTRLNEGPPTERADLRIEDGAEIHCEDLD